MPLEHRTGKTVSPQTTVCDVVVCVSVLFWAVQQGVVVSGVQHGPANDLYWDQWG